MNDFSLIEKIKILMDLIAGSPLFLFCSMIGICLLIYFVICITTNRKINKWVFILLWILLLIILIINYNSVVFNLIDNLFDSLFMALYFPSTSVYISILIASNFFFAYSIFNKKENKSYKIINIASALIIDILLILIIDIISKNNIDIHNTLEVYSNSNLLVLLEISVSIFVSWLLINLLITAHIKLQKYDKKEIPKMPEIIFDDNNSF